MLLVVGAVLAAVRVLDARSAATEGRTEVEEAITALEAGDLESARDRLVGAEDLLARSRGGLGSIWVRPLALVPFAGTEIRAARAGVVATHESTLALLDVLGFLLAERPPLLEGRSLGAEALLGLEEAMRSALAHAEVAEAEAVGAPDPRLASIADPLVEVRDAASLLRRALAGSVPIVDRLQQAAAGGDPYRVFVLFENGAETRATGGLPGFYGFVEVDEGRLNLDRVGAIQDLQARDAANQFIPVPAPSDYTARYGSLEANTTLWLNVNLSPDFPSVATVVRGLLEVDPGVQVDAVARIDLVGLGYLLGAFDSITIDGEPLDPSTLATDFLITTYLDYPNPFEQNEYLASAVAQVFDQVLGGAGGDRGELVSALRQTVEQRRAALVVDGPPETVDLLRDTGADGALDPSAPGRVGVYFQNVAGNKVDLFTTSRLDVTVAFEQCTVTGGLTFELTNGVPAELADLLPAATSPDQAVWWLTTYLPAEAGLLGARLDGAPATGQTGSELGRQYVAATVRAGPGETRELTIEWQETIDGPDYVVRLQPQALLNQTAVTVNGGEPFFLSKLTEIPFATECGDAG